MFVRITIADDSFDLQINRGHAHSTGFRIRFGIKSVIPTDAFTCLSTLLVLLRILPSEGIKFQSGYYAEA